MARRSLARLQITRRRWMIGVCTLLGNGGIGMADMFHFFSILDGRSEGGHVVL